MVRYLARAGCFLTFPYGEVKGFAHKNLFFQRIAEELISRIRTAYVQALLTPFRKEWIRN